MKNNNSIFISSTGTEIGKTYCFIEIIKKLIKKKKNINIYKPIISGFDIKKIEETDSYKILEANNYIPNIENVIKISPWSFKAPLAPSVAAKKENKNLIYTEVLKWTKKKILNSKNNIINIF